MKKLGYFLRLSCKFSTFSSLKKLQKTLSSGEMNGDFIYSIVLPVFCFFNKEPPTSETQTAPSVPLIRSNTNSDSVCDRTIKKSPDLVVVSLWRSAGHCSGAPSSHAARHHGNQQPSPTLGGC